MHTPLRDIGIREGTSSQIQERELRLTNMESRVIHQPDGLPSDGSSYVLIIIIDFQIIGSVSGVTEA